MKAFRAFAKRPKANILAEKNNDDDDRRREHSRSPIIGEILPNAIEVAAWIGGCAREAGQLANVAEYRLPIGRRTPLARFGLRLVAARIRRVAFFTGKRRHRAQFT